MDLHSRALGSRAEAAVYGYYFRRGFRLVKRNWHYSRRGEIDLIVCNSHFLIFVEVKARRRWHSCPGEAVDRRKAQRIFFLAERFLELNPFLNELIPRIDVASVWIRGEEYFLEVLENAVTGNEF